MQEMSYVHQSCLPRDALIAGRPGGFAGINRGELYPGLSIGMKNRAVHTELEQSSAYGATVILHQRSVTAAYMYTWSTET
jgi:hypothetical protein